jgi:hypothetical protein
MKDMESYEKDMWSDEKEAPYEGISTPESSGDEMVPDEYKPVSSKEKENLELQRSMKKSEKKRRKQEARDDEPKPLRDEGESPTYPSDIDPQETP